MGGREKNKKKAKKKSKANAKDSWTLDGGTEVEGKREFVDENGRRIKRQTQEQDEVKRRGSLKTAYNDQISQGQIWSDYVIKYDSVMWFKKWIYHIKFLQNRIKLSFSMIFIKFYINYDPKRSQNDLKRSKMIKHDKVKSDQIML